MLVVKTYVAQSRLHGCGVFAAEPIAAGAVVWEPHPVIDCEITPEELKTLPAVARELAISHSFIDENGRIILSRDNAVFFNHSDEPNTRHEGDKNIAARDIAVGEELTEDYRDFPPGACRSFLDK